MHITGKLAFAWALFLLTACRQSNVSSVNGEYKHDPSTPGISVLEAGVFTFDGKGSVVYSGKIGDITVSGNGIYKVEDSKITVSIPTNQIHDLAGSTWVFLREGNRITLDNPNQKAAYEKAN